MAETLSGVRSRADVLHTREALSKLKGEAVACRRCRTVTSDRTGRVTAVCHVCQDFGEAAAFVEEGGHWFCSPRCYGRRENG